MARINQDLRKLHNCLGKKRRCLEMVDLKIATDQTEELILQQDIQSKKETVADLAKQEKKIKRNLTVAGMFKKASDQISEIEATAECTQDQLEGLEEELSSLKDEVEELQEVVERAKKKAKKGTM
jgi:chromosome segregation ATPase